MASFFRMTHPDSRRSKIASDLDDRSSDRFRNCFDGLRYRVPRGALEQDMVGVEEASDRIVANGEVHTLDFLRAELAGDYPDNHAAPIN